MDWVEAASGNQEKKVSRSFKNIELMKSDFSALLNREVAPYQEFTEHTVNQYKWHIHQLWVSKLSNFNIRRKSRKFRKKHSFWPPKKTNLVGDFPWSRDYCASLNMNLPVPRNRKSNDLLLTLTQEVSHGLIIRAWTVQWINLRFLSKFNHNTVR